MNSRPSREVMRFTLRDIDVLWLTTVLQAIEDAADATSQTQGDGLTITIPFTKHAPNVKHTHDLAASIGTKIQADMTK